jgi:hypothetical protein
VARAAVAGAGKAAGAATGGGADRGRVGARCESALVHLVLSNRKYIVPRSTEE